MPRPKKFQNALECPTCLKICKSESGLTRYCNTQHPYDNNGSNFPLKGYKCTSNLSPDPIVVPGIPPDIMDVPVSSISLTVDQSLHEEISGYEDLSQSSWELSGEPSDDSQYDSDITTDGDDGSVTTDVTTDETTVSHNIDRRELAQQHESLAHYSAGYIYETQGTGSRVFEIQNNLRIEDGHPFSPWVNEDEFWLTYVMFVKAGISMSACIDLLDGFRIGRISMRGGLSFSTSSKMLNVIDQAKFVTVFI